MADSREGLPLIPGASERSATEMQSAQGHGETEWTKLQSAADALHPKELHQMIAPAGIRYFSLPVDTVYTPALLGYGLMQNWLMVLQQCYLPFLVSVFLQCAFVYYLYEMIALGDEEVIECQSSWAVRHLCVFVFFLSVFDDLAVTWAMVEWLWYCPTAKSIGALISGGDWAPRRAGEPLMLDPKEIFSDFPNQFAPSWPKSESWKGLEDDVDPQVRSFLDNNPQVANLLDRGNGLTTSHKVLDCIFVLYPKLLVALALGALGAMYIARSEQNEDAILNALALNFVMDLDELLFKACSDPILSSVLEFVPPVRAKQNGDCAVYAFIFCGVLPYILLIIFATLLADKFACPAAA